MLNHYWQQNHSLLKTILCVRFCISRIIIITTVKGNMCWQNSDICVSIAVYFYFSSKSINATYLTSRNSGNLPPTPSGTRHPDALVLLSTIQPGGKTLSFGEMKSSSHQTQQSSPLWLGVHGQKVEKFLGHNWYYSQPSQPAEEYFFKTVYFLA